MLKELQEHISKIRMILEALQQQHKDTDYLTILNYVHKCDLLLTREITKQTLKVEVKARAKPAARHLSEFKRPMS